MDKRYYYDPKDYSDMPSYYDLYLAGPFFNPQQKQTMRSALELFRSAGLIVCNPQELSPVIKDTKEKLDTDLIFRRNVEGINRSGTVVACIDDRDTGTAFELGYAYALKTPRINIFTFSAHGYGCNVMLAHCSHGHFATLDDLASLAANWEAHKMRALHGLDVKNIPPLGKANADE